MSVKPCQPSKRGHQRVFGSSLEEEKRGQDHVDHPRLLEEFRHSLAPRNAEGDHETGAKHRGYREFRISFSTVLQYVLPKGMSFKLRRRSQR